MAIILLKIYLPVLELPIIIELSTYILLSSPITQELIEPLSRTLLEPSSNIPLTPLALLLLPNTINPLASIELYEPMPIELDTVPGAIMSCIL